MFYIVIMAGGKGERFWPKSVWKKPKQFHRIVSERTMIQESFFRIFPEVKQENIFIVAGEDLKQLIFDQLPQLDEKNLVVEPEGKNTAAAIGLAAVYLSKKNPDATMVVLTADHAVKPRKEFIRAIETAVKVAQEGRLVTFGIKPNRPATEYGYIETGGKLEGDFDLDVYAVKQFQEKPSYERALAFIEEGSFLWNSGMFTFSLKSILDAMLIHMPILHSALMKIYNSIGTEEEDAVKQREFKRLESISIDYGVMERADNICCVRSNFLWDDVGSWGAISRHLPTDRDGNILQGNVITVDAKNNIVIGEDESIISMVGISDAIVVKEKDKLLICHREQDQKVKEIIKALWGNEKYVKFR